MPGGVVAWHGHDVPYKYDLSKFCNVGSISFDHIDPSIFTVLTAPTDDPATPLADFLIFSPRWDVASHTFRPPYMHRNAASEFMGLIKGEYGGRSDDFLPGGASYECGHVPHGVDNDVFEAASNIEQNGAQWILECYARRDEDARRSRRAGDDAEHLNPLSRPSQVWPNGTIWQLGLLERGGAVWSTHDSCELSNP